MGLGNFSDSGEEQSNTSRKYKRIKQAEFEEFIEDVQGDFRIIGTEEDSNLAFVREIVYATPLPHDDLQLRLYSTIDERTGKARDKGDDAIRTVIWSKKQSMPVGGRTKTLRIQTWKNNLGPKIQTLYDEWDDRVVECDDCGSWMVKKTPGKGDDWTEFMGCSKYPVCKNTKNITKLREAEGMKL